MSDNDLQFPSKDIASSHGLDLHTCPHWFPLLEPAYVVACDRDFLYCTLFLLLLMMISTIDLSSSSDIAASERIGK